MSMISIAGIILPEKSVWTNRTAYGIPSSAVITDIDGFEHIYTGKCSGNIDISVPQTKNGLTREDALALSDMAAACAKVSVILEETVITAVFRYGENPVDLLPSAVNGYFYGNLRLREV